MDGKQLLVEGAGAVRDDGVGLSWFSELTGTDSEYAYKRRCMELGTVMYHAHIGLSTWQATAEALGEVTRQLEAAGHRLDRFGLCIERGMSVPAAVRDGMPRETGPRLEDGDWDAVAQAALSQPHLGDFMIGTAASLENTLHALRAGITTIGNLGQYFTFDVPGGGSAAEVTAATTRALGAMAAARDRGAVVHSYLDDGPAMQFSHYGNYLAWAALETHVVETLVGARLAHCYGGLVPQPKARAFLGIALKQLHEPGSVGSMIYGNTVDYTRDPIRNQAVLSTYLLVDIATQLRCPTGHALNPVPLTENARIPDADEILEVHRVAREIEREARRSADLFDWAGIEADAVEAVDYARRASARMLECLAEDGVDVHDPAAVLGALRFPDVRSIERRLRMQPPPGLARLEPWKAGTARVLATDVTSAAKHQLDGTRVVLASLDVHDLMRDVLVSALPDLGAEVVVLPNDSRAEAIASAAVAEDADAVVVSTYNGSALTQGKLLSSALADAGFDGVTVMGGVLNEEKGHGLPVDVRDEIRALGIACPAQVTEVPALLAGG